MSIKLALLAKKSIILKRSSNQNKMLGEIIPRAITVFLAAVSSLAVIVSVPILIGLLIKKLNKKELITLGALTLTSLLMRVLFGHFGPWQPNVDYIDSLLGLFASVESLWPVKNFFYAASGGLYETIYSTIMLIVPGSGIMQVYIISLFIDLVINLLVFLLAFNLFKNKKIAFVSFLFYGFNPLFIKMSATESNHIISSLILLLFINFFIHLYRKSSWRWWECLLLILLFISNMLGRKEYMAFSILWFGFLITIYTAFSSRFRSKIKEEKKFLIFLISSLAVCLFYGLFFVLPQRDTAISMGVQEIRHNINYITNFKLLPFLRGKINTSFNWLHQTFTPWYFSIFLFLSFFVLIINKKIHLLLFNIVLLLSYLVVAEWSIVDFRRAAPIITLLVPQIGYCWYLAMKKIKISENLIIPITLLIVTLSIPQNYFFLQSESSRKVEQDFLIRKIEKEIPDNSLIITIHESKHQFKEIELGLPGINPGKPVYKYYELGLEFPSYILPVNRRIHVLDLNQVDDFSGFENYDHVFYYRPLYGYHETEPFFEYNPETAVGTSGIPPHEAITKFEDKNSEVLEPIKSKEIDNYGYDVNIDLFKEKMNLNIIAKGGLEIGLFRINADPGQIHGI